MGVCGSANKNTIKIQEYVDTTIDYESIREEYKENKDYGDTFEVEARLYDIQKINKLVKKKTLISKYLFFNTKGEFNSYVSKNKPNDLIIKGTLNPINRTVYIQTKEQLLENNQYRVKNYYGDLKFVKNQFIAEGIVTQDNKNVNIKEAITFELDFTTHLWKGFYYFDKNYTNDNSNLTKVNFNGYINHIDVYYNGIAYDDWGISLIKGTINEKNEIKLNQNYILTNNDINMQDDQINHMKFNDKNTLNNNNVKTFVSNTFIGEFDPNNNNIIKGNLKSNNSELNDINNNKFKFVFEIIN